MSNAQKWIHPQKNLTAGTWKEVPGKGWKKEILVEKPIILRFHVEFWESIPSSPPPSKKKKMSTHATSIRLPFNPPIFLLPGHKASSGTFSPEGLAGGEALDVLATGALASAALACCCCSCLGGTWSVDVCDLSLLMAESALKPSHSISLLTLFCGRCEVSTLTLRMVKVKGFLDEDLAMDFWDPMVFPWRLSRDKPDKPRPWQWQPLQPWLLLVP